MEFSDSAHKHGISETDALHAIENAMVASEQYHVDESRTLILGPHETQVLRPIATRRKVIVTKTTSKQSVEEWLDSLDPATMVFRDGRHMREISAAAAALDAAEDRLHEAVAAARSAGDSWNMIGIALGTSRQAAHRKFAP